MCIRDRGSCARVWSYKSYVENALFLLKSSSLLRSIDQTNQVCSNDDHGRVYQNCKFVLGRGHISHVVKMHYFFKNILLYSQALIRHTKYIVMMTKEGSTKIVNFI